MEIETKPYGKVEIETDKILTIIGGLYGFEDKEEFALIGKEEQRPFEWLQSTEDPELAFVVCRPELIKSDFELSLLEDDYNELDADSIDDLITYTIVVVRDDPEDMTMNLKGPIVINQSNFVGKQVINQVDEYTVRHRVFDEIQNLSSITESGEPN